MGSRMQLLLKRLIDLALGFIGLILLAVPFLIIALAIKIDSKGPVFFRQVRIGKGGKPFRVWKFRTMVEGAEKRGLGPTVARDDERITRVGRTTGLGTRVTGQGFRGNGVRRVDSSWFIVRW